MFGAESLRNILEALQPWWTATFVLAYLIGFAMVGAGVLGLMRQRYGDTGVGGAIAALIFGSILASLPAWLDALSMSFLGGNSMASLSSADVSASDADETTLVLLTSYAVVQLVGLFGVIKGLILFRQSADTRDRLGPAFVHTIGGAFAINLVTILDAAARTVGGSAGEAIRQLLPG